VGPGRTASWVVAIAQRYAAPPPSGRVCPRPKWEGHLVGLGAVKAGLRHDGKGAVYSSAVGVHYRRANVLPRAAPGQVGSVLLERYMYRLLLW
jgi:hypothetical protein